MNKLESLLNEEKENLDNINIPEDMEDRLRSALEEIPVKNKRKFHLKTAAIIIIVLLLSYNVDTLAFYGKRLIGYDNVMNGTLQELNDSGRGQIINKTYTFSNEVSVTLDGVMMDANNLIMFYTIEDPEKNVEEVSSRMNINVSGFLNNNLGYGGAGETDNEGRYQRWVVTTSRAPKFYEKTLSLNISYSPEGKDVEEGEIRFKLDRNAALGNNITIPINKKVHLRENNSITVKSMVASPTITVVKGQIQNILQLGWDQIVGERFSASDIEMSLYADKIEVPMQGRSISTDMKGMNFEIRFDTLPQEVKTLELKLTSFINVHEVDEPIKLKKGEEDTVKILDQEITINDVYEEDGNTFVKITSEEYTTLPRVSLNINGTEQRLVRTRPVDMEKVVSGESAKIYYTRILEFAGIGEDLKLQIKGLSFNETFDEVIFSYNFR
ncbi:DUF4179 domain-containing protein [Tissierella sp. Yu-01]|uniref:DUF4179 domain-containing protein n=1 Tax=Tissierella sp. Yu-01 TaxID=3035694 RepID=UPI00240E358D|nr:DUF4179 domain-containing protein [Tissierella sp. Yu-01]WFA08444.1 DUF4179 domain-containing protein [Tissierella sp. Yu-01]